MYTANDMDELSNRQIDILKAIIEEYAQTGDAVGSDILDKKYKLGVSPATIRNEMVVLAHKGFLKKSHFSAGRVPSAKGYRFYITRIMKEQQLSTIDEIGYKNGLWDDRETMHKLLSHGTKMLAEKTGLIALSVTNTGEMYYAGVSNIFNYLSQDEMQTMQRMCHLLDQYSFWQQVMNRQFATDQDIMYLVGEEDFQDPLFEKCATIVGDFHIGDVRGMIGLLGTKRMRFEVYIPQVRYFSHLLEEIAVVA
jgi:heat-inducible transcriptional repressor